MQNQDSKDDIESCSPDSACIAEKDDVLYVENTGDWSFESIAVVL
jgi:hypothetical protein